MRWHCACLLHFCLLCRLVAQCEKEGLRRLADDMQIHNQRLQDVVHEARTGQDG